MNPKKTDLSQFKNKHFQPGSISRRLAWYVANRIFINTSILFPSIFKSWILKLFGAKIGRGLVIKPKVNIKYPWFLTVGDHCWIGENVWIDNLTQVSLEANVCISQGAMLLTGNHDYKKASFDLILEGIRLEDGVWIGSKSVVCPGVTCFSHSVLAVGSVATKDLDSFTIYQGNPAQAIRKREIV
ncbi:WcaF family extracellular polysaccharide biosynthesis acetyltransferase [Aquiflexum sp. LQ15W]|uniref:WcaF family extracellular polysaccharide biosynthesis acetyltransferase n=1 Tax=Cognataquiflexum nitidum TaxID=2922272 RepID=UPI001F12E725|nr:WcaF family extracellular polysaccharide biosynthesis acetyltransferase [Cognataquiflexum nitidum]MCH6201331.1 WcaF family extracellular polysaccharide biosynthesis acetyltransferase [Cognataquiflexum nitidum]